MSANVKPEYYLEQVHKVLSKDDKTTENNKNTLATVLDGLCTVMKECDPLFRLMFKRLFYTGSSYEGLRIREADEFDINLVLKLPVQGDEFQLVAEKPGHVSYTLTKGCRGRILDSMEGPLVQSFFGLFSRQLKFQPQLLRTWFQGVMDKALRAYTPPSGDDGSRLFEVRLSQSGPAKTLYVHLSGGGRIDIDLVPVLEHSYDQLPADVPRQEWVKELPELDKMWFMVPKNPEDNEDLWRIHFPTAEKKFIKDFKCLKPTIRLIKALRDRHSWKLLSSYSIKTVVMRHRLEKPQPSYWLKDNQWTVLLEVLERLQMELLADGPGICSLFDKNVSLIQGLGVETRKNIAARLKRIVNILTKYPERTLEFFLEPSPSVPSESSPTGDEVMIRQLSGLSLLASDVSFGEISTDCGVDSRDSSFANGALDVSLGNQVCVLADRTQEAGIIVSQKLELLGENVRAAPIQVTLSVLLSDGRLLGETSTTLHSCPDQTVAVPLGRLTGLTAVSLLVVRLCFEAAGQTASAPKDVTSVLSVMTAGGRQLVNSRFHIRVCNRVQQCELRLPFPQVE